MTAPRKIVSDVFSIGAIDWDRRLFDELIPLPDGTSYNAYLVRGDETALIDTVDPPFWPVLMRNLERLGAIPDYVIANHAEQDHSGSLPAVVEKYPEIKVVCTPRCQVLLEDHLHIPEDRVVTVEDGEALNLGKKTLEFHHIPWAHWPETMATYLKEDRILFPCDFFGSHMATSDLFADPKIIYEPAKRYYAEIMMPFRSLAKKNTEKVAALDVNMIAPSHGPIYSDPSFIMAAYQDWTSDSVKNEVVIPYVSMHGSTRIMVDYFVDALVERGIGVRRFDLTVTDLGKLAEALVDAATIVVGACTVLTGPHPKAADAVFVANALRPKARFVSIIGSYGWGTKIVEVLQGMITRMDVEVIEPVLAKGLPRDGDFEALDRLADEILERHRGLGIT